jgi:hypothetical protein
MTVDVTVLDDGSMELTVDSQTWSPIPLAAVEAMVALVPAAQAAAQRQGLTASIRVLTDVLVSSGPDMTADVQVTGTSVAATVDQASFERAQQVTGATPDANGKLKVGPVTITAASPAPATPPAA